MDIGKSSQICLNTGITPGACKIISFARTLKHFALKAWSSIDLASTEKLYLMIWWNFSSGESLNFSSRKPCDRDRHETSKWIRPDKESSNCHAHFFHNVFDDIEIHLFPSISYFPVSRSQSIYQDYYKSHTQLHCFLFHRLNHDD